MNGPGEGTSPHQQALDWLFSRLAGNTLSEPATSAEVRPHAPPGSADAELAPVVRSQDDLTAATEWLQRQRQRPAAYTRAQLARIQDEPQALVQQNYLLQQGLILRSQELARKEEMLLARG